MYELEFIFVDMNQNYQLDPLKVIQSNSLELELVLAL